jgi:hypothetical protein
MGEKGMDPNVAQTNPGMGVAAMPSPFDKMQEVTPSQSAPPPPKSGPSTGDVVTEVVGDVLDPLGLHKLF